MKGKISSWLSPFVLILAFAFIFSSNFIVETSLYDGSSLINSLTSSLSKVFFLFIPAMIAHRNQVSIKNLYYVLIIVSFLKLTVSTIQDLHPVLLSISMILTGGVVGLGLLVVVASFSLFSANQARRYLLLGFAAVSLVRPVFHLFPISEGLIYEMCLYAFLLLITVFVFTNNETNSAYPAVKSTFEDRQAEHGCTSKKGVLTKLISAPDRIVLVIFVGMLLMVFSFGAFEAYSIPKGLTLMSSDTVMYAAFAISMLILLATSIPGIKLYFDEAYRIVWVVFILLYLIALAFAEYSPILFVIMGTGFIVLHISLLIDIVESSIKDGVSPIFRFGVFYAALVLVHAIGASVSLLQILLIGSEDYFVSHLVTVGIAALSFVLTVVFTILVIRKDQMTPQNQDSVNVSNPLERFSAHYGLSEREQAIVGLYSQGRDVGYISSKLFLSQSTVRAYTRQAYTKLGVHNKQEMLDLIETEKL